MPSGRWRDAADGGPWSKTTSRTQGSRFSIFQHPWTHAATPSGRARVMAASRLGWVTSTALPGAAFSSALLRPQVVLVRRTRTT